MAFNSLEYLKNGNVEFISNCTQYDYDCLIRNIRKAPDRVEIINGFFSKLKDRLPVFCFRIIYDIPEFANEAYELFDIKKVPVEMFKSILQNSPLGLRVLYENFDTIFSPDLGFHKCIFEYAFSSNNKELLHRLSRHSNLHIRYLFMKYLIENHPVQIDILYDDITKYTTSFTNELYEQLTFIPQLMDSEDIAKIAVLLLGSGRKDDYKKLKDFILKNYEKNHLACELLTMPYKNVSPGVYISDNEKGEMQKKVFNEDADTLFITAANYRFHILYNYSASISKELLDEFAHRMRYFLEFPLLDRFCSEQTEYYLKGIDYSGLGHLLETWTEKYMDLSSSKEYGFLGGGTTCNCYRIGDYVIKMVKTKWSYEDVICPDLYIIAKNYEEIYVRRSDETVASGLEVQKYLSRTATDIDPKYFLYFDRALEELGYKRTDTLIHGRRGDNTMLLDTYRDADCRDPEKLPDWFKECPLVLVDRDRIYPKDKEFIKEIRENWY